jgi:hypothetical protein
VRLAAVVALIEDAALAEIGPAALARGITLARFYAAEALRLIDLPGAEDGAKDSLALLRRWLMRKHAGGEISLRDVYCRGPAAFRSQAAARRAMHQLEAEGVAELVPPEDDTHGNSGDRWRIADPAAANLQHSAA